MRLSRFIEGLLILKPYYKDPDGSHIGAEHDQFYAYATDRPLSVEDADRMHTLGWFQPELSGDDVTYDPLDGWSAFT